MKKLYKKIQSIYMHHRIKCKYNKHPFQALKPWFSFDSLTVDLTETTAFTDHALITGSMRKNCILT